MFTSNEIKTNPNVNHPSYYNKGKFEAIEVIEDWNLGFCLGNTVKYIARAGSKSGNSELQDLEKALWYLERRIKEIEDGNEKDEPLPFE